MNDFILLMHDDTTSPVPADLWDAYFAALSDSGVFGGGSSIGGGVVRRDGQPPGPLGAHLTGFIRITADTLEAAQAWVVSNPVFLCGGTVEVRYLPRD
jgi:hypothetical protein